MISVGCQILVVSALRSGPPDQLRIDHDIVPSVSDLVFKLLTFKLLWHHNGDPLLASMLQVSCLSRDSHVVVVGVEGLGGLRSLKIMLQSLVPVLGRVVGHVVFVNEIVVNFPFDDRLVLVLQVILNLVFLSFILFVCWVPKVILLF